MVSTYTNNGFEQPGDGDQTGTWGQTLNTNFELIDQAIDGQGSVTLPSTGTTGSPNTIDVTDGTSSNGRNAFIEVNDGGDLGATAYLQLTPNSAKKFLMIRNSLTASRDIIVFQGTYNTSNDAVIPNGETMLLRFDGGGAGAVVEVIATLQDFAALTAADITATTELRIPVGTTAERPSAPAQGDIRRNTTTSSWEGYDGSGWGNLGGAGLFKGENGTTGDSVLGAGDIFRVHEQELNTDVTIGASENAIAAGPLTVASGVTLTVTSGGNLVIA